MGYVQEDKQQSKFYLRLLVKNQGKSFQNS